ncbi:MAG: M28 family peptidase [Thermoproteus sp.]|nr:M28 family peptidase [Thermoproteus sp.]
MGEIAEKCASLRDLVAGAPEEKEWIEFVASVLDVPFVWLQYSPVEVLYWRDRGSRLEVDGGAVDVLAMPYSPAASVEGRLVEAKGNVEGEIALAPLPRDVNDAKYAVIEAARRGALAVVFYGEPRRRIVVTDELGFKYDAAPPPIPAASAPEEVAELAGRRAKLVVDVDARPAYSYNIIAMNSFEDTPMISAHFDHWLAGASDNCGGVEAAVLAFLDLVAEDYPIALGLFTAEEGVAPHVPSLYWAWGSRVYLKRWKPKLLVNLDVVGRGSPRAYAMPYIAEAVKGLLPVDKPRADYDTLNFELSGRPAVTISSLEDVWPIYHSPLDDGVDESVVLFVAETAKRLAKIKPEEPRVDLLHYGLPVRPSDPHEAWASVYNYLVLFKGFDHSDIVYANVFEFLRGEAHKYRRIDLLGGPTLCVGDCGRALDVYREIVYLKLI